MKLKLTKTTSTTFDTSVERKRLERIHKTDPKFAKEMNYVLDLIEDQNWEDAFIQLSNDYWTSDDPEMECPRIEFVGALGGDSPWFDSWLTYSDLIYRMYINPEIYKVERI